MSRETFKLYLSAYRETLHWLDKKSANDLGEILSKSAYADIWPELPAERAKYLRVLLPININYGEALPAFENCQFTLLALTHPLPDSIATDISCLTDSKRFQMLTALNTQLPVDIIDVLFSPSTRDINKSAIDDAILNILCAYQSKKFYRKRRDCKRPTISDLSNVQKHSPSPTQRDQLFILSVSPSGKGKLLASLDTRTAGWPSAQKLKSYCKTLHRSVWPVFLLNSSSSLNSLVPPHMGWTFFGCTPYYHGTTSFHAGYRNMKLQECTRLCQNTSSNKLTCRMGLADALQLAPDEVTFPLFAYTLFSLLKPFIPQYPARMSNREPYYRAAKKLDHVIALSIAGKHALELSHFFCGTFLEYEKSFRPATYQKMQTPEKSRVHDGVVIYTNNYKTGKHKVTEKRFEQLLLHNACSLFTDAELPTDSRLISITTPNEYNADLSSLINTSPIPSIISSFTNHIAKLHKSRQKHECRSCYKQLFELFLKHYNSAKQYLPANIPIPTTVDIRQLLSEHAPPFANWDGEPQQYPPLKHLLYPFARLFLKLDEALLKAEIYAPPIPHSKQIEKILQGNTTKYAIIPSILYRTPTNAAYAYAEFLVAAQLVYKDCASKINSSIIDYDAAFAILKKQFGSDMSMAKNYAYLLASFLSFSTFMFTEDAKLGATLSSRATEVFSKLCQCRPSPEGTASIYQSLVNYLSTEIKQHKIILIRGEATQSVVSGWYDPKREFLYLPYASYFEAFNAYCAREENLQLPYTKTTFQELVLYPKGIVQPKENGSASQYFRPDCKIKVAPASLPSAPAETVVKLSIPALTRVYPFSAPVLEELYQMSRTPIKRRVAKPKE